MSGQRSQTRMTSSQRYSKLSSAGKNLMKSMQTKSSIRPLTIKSVRRDSSKAAGSNPHSKPTPKISKHK